MQKFEGVANTLFVPLVARIAVCPRFWSFPEYFNTFTRKRLLLLSKPAAKHCLWER